MLDVGIAIDGGNDVNNNAGKGELTLCKRKGMVAALEEEIKGNDTNILLLYIYFSDNFIVT